ncbi:MAG: hypothetical protein ABIK28_04190, partial [Planctomycetota bacterium]
MTEQKDGSRSCRACNDQEESLLLYLDHELKMEAANRFKAHRGACPRCAGALHRLQEQEKLLKAPWPEERAARHEPLQRFLESAVHRHGASEGNGRPVIDISLRSYRSHRFQRAVAAAGVAAALLLLVWGFLMSGPGEIDGKRKSRNRSLAAESARSSHDRGESMNSLSLPDFAEEERLRAHEELQRILIAAAPLSDPELQTCFAEKTRSLEQQGWHVEHMVLSVIKRGAGPAFET